MILARSCGSAGEILVREPHPLQTGHGSLTPGDDRVTVLSLARSLERQIAVTAGLDAALDSDAVVVMDTDLLDPPELSLQLIEAWDAGGSSSYPLRGMLKLAADGILGLSTFPSA